MGDQYTQTGGRTLYTIRFEPNGEKAFVHAGNAQSAAMKAAGIAETGGIQWNGSFDVYPTTDIEQADFEGYNAVDEALADVADVIGGGEE